MLLTSKEFLVLKTRTNEHQVWIFLCIEHGMLMFKYGLEAIIPDSPADVGIQLARNEFLVSKASNIRLHPI